MACICVLTFEVHNNKQQLQQIFAKHVSFMIKIQREINWPLTKLETDLGITAF